MNVSDAYTLLSWLRGFSLLPIPRNGGCRSAMLCTIMSYRQLLTPQLKKGKHLFLYYSVQGVRIFL